MAGSRLRGQGKSVPTQGTAPTRTVRWEQAGTGRPRETEGPVAGGERLGQSNEHLLGWTTWAGARELGLGAIQSQAKGLRL